MIRNRLNAFGWGAIVLHWAIAVLVLGLMGLGCVMTRPDIDPALQFSLYQWHKSFGMTALALVVIRLIWWLFNVRPDAIATLTPLEKRSSGLVHAGLHAVTLAVPLAGWAIASTSTLNIPTFFFDSVVIPHLPLAKSDAAETLWTSVHSTLAYSLLGLVVLHAGAALYHHIWRRDAVLVGMLQSGRTRDIAKNPSISQ